MTKGLRYVLFAATCVCGSLVAADLQAQDYFGYYAFPTPAQQQWAGTSQYTAAVGDDCNGFNASLYPAPRRVPQFVGHTYYTYPPLYPHHYLYKHSHHGIYCTGGGFTLLGVNYW